MDSCRYSYSIYILVIFLFPRSRSNDQEGLPEEEHDEQRGNENELSNEKIDNIDRKLKAIENHIIEDTVKYTGAHDRKLI